jgi:hypothetical protein
MIVGALFAPPLEDWHKERRKLGIGGLPWASAEFV